MPALADDLPDDPGKVPVPAAENWVIGTLGTGDIDGLDALMEGDVFCQQVLANGSYQLTKGGLLFSEKKAVKLGEYEIAYDEIRALYSIDLKAWDLKESVYKNEVEKCSATVEKLSKPPGFWAKNGGYILFTLGLALGVGATVGIAYAISGAN